MALLRKNIWTLFILLFAGSVFFLALISYYRWVVISDTYRIKQANLVDLVSNASHSLFLNQEVILDILGSELIKESGFDREPKKLQLLDKLARRNPAIVGFGLARPDGQLTFVSSNLNLSKLPNLKDNPDTRDSFMQALNSDAMVLGRTYYMPAIDEWLIPIRKAIRRADGRVIAVMTSGLRIGGNARFFSNRISMNSGSRISQIRSRDGYMQFVAGDAQDLETAYSTPVADALLSVAIAKIEKQTGQTLEQVKASEELVSFMLLQPQRKSIITVRYDKRFEYWTVAETGLEHLVDDFLDSFWIYLLTFVVGQVVIYQLFRLIATAESKRREDLIFQASHDPLTQLPNRSYLSMHKGQWLNPQRPFSVLYVDMDHFKSVNDSFGHEFGDEVLRELAQRMQAVSPPDATLVRQGGDEFLMFLHETDRERLLSLSRVMIAELSRPYRVAGIDFTLGASVGIALYPQHGEDLDNLLRAADLAMYEAKKHKNSVRIFADEMQKDHLQKLRVEQMLRKGLDNDELFMVYQPQIDQQGRLYGVEALVRWQSPELGFMPPDKFIAIAEASGLMPKLGEFVLRRSLKEMSELQQAFGLDFHVSVNVSVRQFMQANFMTLLQDVVQGTPLNISLEITESLFIEDLDYILPLLNRIHDMGIQVSMDDFGTGYSSLSMLRALPVDELKIDKSFVDNILSDVAARKMIQNIIAIGKNYEMAVLAEGVETQEQADLLARYGCDRFQGYLFARPMPVSDLRDYLQTCSATQTS